METTRQNKISRLIQKELSEIFLLQTKSMNGVLVSVSAVRISPDMSIARVYLSVFPSERSQEIVKNINDNMKSIRYELGTRVRHQLRIIPELKFFVDDSLDYAERIDERIMPLMSFQPFPSAEWLWLHWHWYVLCLFLTASRIWWLLSLRLLIRS